MSLCSTCSNLHTSWTIQLFPFLFYSQLPHCTPCTSLYVLCIVPVPLSHLTEFSLTFLTQTTHCPHAVSFIMYPPFPTPHHCHSGALRTCPSVYPVFPSSTVHPTQSVTRISYPVDHFAHSMLFSSFYALSYFMLHILHCM